MAKSGISAQNIIFVNRDGKVYYIEPEESRIVGTDMSVYPEVKEALKAGRPTISGLVSTPLVAIPVVLISTPIFDAGGETIGVLMSSIDVEQSSIGVFSQSITLGRTGYTEIVDGNGIVLARTKPGSPPEIFERSDHPGRFAELISQGKATVGTCHRCHETKTDVQRRRDVLAFAPLTKTSWGGRHSAIGRGGSGANAAVGEEVPSHRHSGTGQCFSHGLDNDARGGETHQKAHFGD